MADYFTLLEEMRTVTSRAEGFALIESAKKTLNDADYRDFQHSMAQYMAVHGLLTAIRTNE